MRYHITSAHGSSNQEDSEIYSLLIRVYVYGGYTDRAQAEKSFAPSALRKTGDILLARSDTGELVGMVICAGPTAEQRQLATPNEAEMRCLCVDVEHRGQGIATDLITACEQLATSFGLRKIVLTTQPVMKSAQYLYERLGYQRNEARDWSTTADKIYLVYEKELPS